MYGKIAFTWSLDMIWPHAGMKMTPLVPGAGMEPSVIVVLKSAWVTLSVGLRSVGTTPSAVLGFGAPFAPT